MRVYLTTLARMCDQHLRAEHDSIHELARAFRKGDRRPEIARMLHDRRTVPQEAPQRHAALAAEMKRRGIGHDSPLVMEVFPNDWVGDYVKHPSWGMWGRVDPNVSACELVSECKRCRGRYESWIHREVRKALRQLQEGVKEANLGNTLRASKLSNVKVEVLWGMKVLGTAYGALNRHHDGELIRLNGLYMVECPEQLWDTTIHEYAHVYVRWSHPGAKPHGKQWKQVMEAVGANPRAIAKINPERRTAAKEAAQRIAPNKPRKRRK